MWCSVYCLKLRVLNCHLKHVSSLKVCNFIVSMWWFMSFSSSSSIFLFYLITVALLVCICSRCRWSYYHRHTVIHKQTSSESCITSWLLLNLVLSAQITTPSAVVNSLTIAPCNGCSIFELHKHFFTALCSFCLRP